MPEFCCLTTSRRKAEGGEEITGYGKK